MSILDIWYNDGGCDGYNDYRSTYKNEKYIFNDIVSLQQIEIVYIYIYIYIYYNNKNSFSLCFR